MLKRFLAAALLLSLPFTAWAQGTVMPSPVFSGFDLNGNPVSLGKLCVYAAGTTTPATTYTSASLAIADTNPVHLNSAGRAPVFLSPGTSYKFVLKTAGTDATCSTGSTLWTVDQVSGVPTTSGNVEVLGTAGEVLTAGNVVYLSDGSGGKTPGSWYKTDSANAYSSTFPAVGMAPASMASGAVGTIRLAGQATGLTSLTVGTTYFVSATAGALTSTAPANRRIIGVADSTSSLVLFPALPSGSSTSTITTTGTQVALTLPSGDGLLTIFANNATLLTLQGITAGKDGQQLALYSIGAGQVDLANQNGSASAANRLINGVTGTISLAAGSGRVLLEYDGTTARWRVLQHEQGAWITPTFVAGDFTGNGGMSWTVGVADFGTMAYRLSGRTLTVSFQVVTSTVVTGGDKPLKIGNGQWGGFISAKGTTSVIYASDNGGAPVVGHLSVANGGTALNLYPTITATTNWSAAVDSTDVRGEITFEVQ